MTATPITIQTIDDFAAHPGAREAIASWDPAQELKDWAKEVRVRQIPWRSLHDWNQPRTKAMFHPSSLGNPCDMYLFLELVGAKERSRTDSSTQLIFDTGTAIHLQMQYYQHTRALVHDYEYHEEVAFWETNRDTRSLRLCGSADGAQTREFVHNGARYSIPFIWEYKTINQSGFERLGSTPDKRYVKQVHGYMKTSGRPLTVLLYYCKNDSSMRAYFIYFDKKLWTEIEHRLRRILEYELHNSDEPERATNRGCFRCKFFTECRPNISRVRGAKPSRV